MDSTLKSESSNHNTLWGWWESLTEKECILCRAPDDENENQIEPHTLVRASRVLFEKRLIQSSRFKKLERRQICISNWDISDKHFQKTTFWVTNSEPFAPSAGRAHNLQQPLSHTFAITGYATPNLHGMKRCFALWLENMANAFNHFYPIIKTSCIYMGLACKNRPVFGVCRRVFIDGFTHQQPNHKNEIIFNCGQLYPLSIESLCGVSQDDRTSMIQSRSSISTFAKTKRPKIKKTFNSFSFIQYAHPQSWKFSKKTLRNTALHDAMNALISIQTQCVYIYYTVIHCVFCLNTNQRWFFHEAPSTASSRASPLHFVICQNVNLTNHQMKKSSSKHTFHRLHENQINGSHCHVRENWHGQNCHFVSMYFHHSTSKAFYRYRMIRMPQRIFVIRLIKTPTHSCMFFCNSTTCEHHHTITSSL